MNEYDLLELGLRVELHLARENIGDQYQRLGNLRCRSLRGNSPNKKQ